MSNLQNLPSCGSSLTSERKRQSSPYFAAVHQGYKVFVTSFLTYPQPFFLVFCMFSFFLLVSLDVLMHNNYWNVALSVHPKRKRNQGAARSFTSANVRSLRASSLDEQFCFDCLKSWLTLLCDWFRKLAPLMQPIRFQIKTNRVLLARVLPHYNPSTPKIW